MQAVDLGDPLDEIGVTSMVRQWMVGIVGSLIAVVTVWIAFEGALAWRRARRENP